MNLLNNSRTIEPMGNHWKKRRKTPLDPMDTEDIDHICISVPLSIRAKIALERIMQSAK